MMLGWRVGKLKKVRHKDGGESDRDEEERENLQSVHSMGIRSRSQLLAVGFVAQAVKFCSDQDSSRV
jgi:hypothetical protein